MKNQLIISSFLLLVASIARASVTAPGVVLPTVPVTVPVAGSHQFVTRTFNRGYVPTIAPYPTYPSYPTYPTTYYKGVAYPTTYPSVYPTTTYYRGGAYPYYPGYYPTYNYGYSWTGGAW